IRDFHVTGVQTCALPIRLFQPLSGRGASGWRTAHGYDLPPPADDGPHPCSNIPAILTPAAPAVFLPGHPTSTPSPAPDKRADPAGAWQSDKDVPAVSSGPGNVRAGLQTGDGPDQTPVAPGWPWPDRNRR